MSKTTATEINAIAFQRVCIISVGGAARGLWWLGPRLSRPNTPIDALTCVAGAQS
jgi:hypothetical protein